MKLRRVRRYLLIFLSTLLGVLILLFGFLNLPFSQRIATAKVNQVLQQVEVPVHIDAIRKILPGSVNIYGVLISNSQGDTIIYTGRLKADIRLLALLRNRVVLQDLELQRAVVDIGRESGEEKLNIAAVFQRGKEEDPAPSDKEPASWEISIKKGELSDIFFRMSDTLSGIHVSQEISELKLKGFMISLAERDMSFKGLDLFRSAGSLALTPRLLEKKKLAGLPWNFGLQTLALEDIDFTFLDESSGLKLETKVGQGNVRTNQLDLLSKTVDLKKIALTDAVATLQTGHTSEQSADRAGDGEKQMNWIFLSESIELENTEAWLGPEPLAQYSMINLNIKEFNLDKDQAGMKLKKLSFELGNGFSLKKMKGGFDSENDHTELQMELETGNSHIAFEGRAEAGLFDLIRDPDRIGKAILEVDESLISMADMACFVTDLKEFPAYALLSSAPVQLEGVLNVEQSVYGFSGISLSQEKNFRLNLEGFMEHPFQFQEATGNLDLEISGLDQDWMESLVAGFGIGDSLPDLRDLHIRAGFSDTLKAPHFDIALSNRDERVEVSGSFDLQKEQFMLTGSFSNLALGDLLSVADLGSFAGTGELKGAGFKGDRLKASFYLNIDTLTYRDYHYGHTLLVGSIEPGEYEFNLVANDASLKGDLNVVMNSADSAMKVKAAGIIQAQLKDLHLYEDTLGLECSLEGTLSISGGELESELGLSDLKFVTPREMAEVRQLGATFTADTARTELQAESDFFLVEMRVSTPVNGLDSLGQEYKQYFASFLDPSHMTATDRLSKLPEIYASGQISDHEVLDMFLQDTGLYFTNIDVTLVHRSDQKSLHAFINGEGLNYKMLQSGALYAVLSDSAGNLIYDLVADQTSLFSGSEKRVQLSGNFANQSTRTTLLVLDTLDQQTYQLEVAGKVDSTRLVFEVPAKQLILNGEVWQMDSPDLLSIDIGSKTVFPAVSMNLDSSYIRMSALNQEPLYQYKIDLNQVKLGSLISKDLLPGNPDGTFTGSIDLSRNRDVERKIVLGLRVSDIRYTEQDIRDIHLDAALTQGQSKDYSMDLLARMDSSRIELKGGRTEHGDRNLHAAFSHFPFISMQPFVADHLSDLGGYISGEFSMDTRREKEELQGELVFEDARLKINILNSMFRIPTQRITMKDERLKFDNFTILDTLNKELIVDGYIDLGMDMPVAADLNISSSKLQLMSRDETSQAPFTGNVFIDSEFSVRGPLSRPDLEGRILLSEGTEIFYQHKEDLRLSESEKVVRFVNLSSDGEEITPPLLSSQSNFINSSIETIVQIDPNTRINFTLDKRMYNIDLNVQGGGQLQYNMLENNQVSLAGSYEIGSGAALMQLTGWPNKSFDIAEGGYIRWQGLVENPELRFEAENKVSSSYINPVDGKQRDIDFYVILQLAGYLSELDILFTIRTPDQYVMSIINTMSPEERMQQAISVLLFEIIDLPGISSSTDYMTQQVNQILASQLNQFTKSTIKGVDISFGLDSYDRSPQEGGGETSTSLTYEVSKSLLNNRAQIEFSGRLHDVNQQPGASDHSLNNVSFEYRLDSAANKYLKVYNEHTYDDVFEGEVIRTGIGFTYRKRYRNLRDIWKRKR